MSRRTTAPAFTWERRHRAMPRAERRGTRRQIDARAAAASAAVFG